MKDAMKTCIQDSQWPDSTYLLEEILVACEDATSGMGVFAFASAPGVKLLLRDPEFSRFLSKSPFELVVGVDAITDINALDAISATAGEHPNLTPRVFLGSMPGSVFHPKMCWFRHPSGGVCLVGSGNLTPGGLRGNCEAFSIARLTTVQLRTLQRKWNSWSRFHESDLLPVDDPRVRRRARENARRNRAQTRPQRNILVEDRNGNISVGPATTDATAVLIAEIPRGGNRWNQANFDIDTFSGFFGAKPGRTQRIMLTHVDTRGLTGPPEVRPSVAVKSHNYRFELEAASDLQYPSRGRPIAIFVRVATRTFRYRLLMPGTGSHRLASEYLKRRCPYEARRVRRLLTNVRALGRVTFFRGLGG